MLRSRAAVVVAAARTSNKKIPALRCTPFAHPTAAAAAASAALRHTGTVRPEDNIGGSGRFRPTPGVAADAEAARSAMKVDATLPPKEGVFNFDGDNTKDGDIAAAPELEALHDWRRTRLPLMFLSSACFAYSSSAAFFAVAQPLAFAAVMLAMPALSKDNTMRLTDYYKTAIPPAAALVLEDLRVGLFNGGRTIAEREQGKWPAWGQAAVGGALVVSHPSIFIPVALLSCCFVRAHFIPPTDPTAFRFAEPKISNSAAWVLVLGIAAASAYVHFMYDFTDFLNESNRDFFKQAIPTEALPGCTPMKQWANPHGPPRPARLDEQDRIVASFTDADGGKDVKPPTSRANHIVWVTGEPGSGKNAVASSAAVTLRGAYDVVVELDGSSLAAFAASAETALTAAGRDAFGPKCDASQRPLAARSDEDQLRQAVDMVNAIADPMSSSAADNTAASVPPNAGRRFLFLLRNVDTQDTRLLGAIRKLKAHVLATTVRHHQQQHENGNVSGHFHETTVRVASLSKEQAERLVAETLAWQARRVETDKTIMNNGDVADPIDPTELAALHKATKGNTLLLRSAIPALSLWQGAERRAGRTGDVASFINAMMAPPPARSADAAAAAKKTQQLPAPLQLLSGCVRTVREHVIATDPVVRDVVDAAMSAAAGLDATMIDETLFGSAAASSSTSTASTEELQRAVLLLERHGLLVPTLASASQSPVVPLPNGVGLRDVAHKDVTKAAEGIDVHGARSFVVHPVHRAALRAVYATTSADDGRESAALAPDDGAGQLRILASWKPGRPEVRRAWLDAVVMHRRRFARAWSQKATATDDTTAKKATHGDRARRVVLTRAVAAAVKDAGMPQLALGLAESSVRLKLHEQPSSTPLTTTAAGLNSGGLLDADEVVSAAIELYSAGGPRSEVVHAWTQAALAAVKVPGVITTSAESRVTLAAALEVAARTLEVRDIAAASTLRLEYVDVQRDLRRTGNIDTLTFASCLNRTGLGLMTPGTTPADAERRQIAAELIRESTALRVEEYGRQGKPDHRDVAVSYLNLSTAHEVAGDSNAAAESAGQAASIFEQRAKADRSGGSLPELATARTVQSLSLLRAERPNEALEAAGAALATHQQIIDGAKKEGMLHAVDFVELATALYSYSKCASSVTTSLGAPTGPLRDGVAQLTQLLANATRAVRRGDKTRCDAEQSKAAAQDIERCGKTASELASELATLGLAKDAEAVTKALAAARQAAGAVASSSSSSGEKKGGGWW